MFGQHPSGQAIDVEVFDCNPAETIDQIAGDFMQLVAPFVGNVAVKPRKRGYTLGSGATAPLAPGDSALSASRAHMPPALIKEVDVSAAANNTTRSDAFRRLVELGLKAKGR